MEILRLIQHARLLQAVTEHLHVIGIEHASILLYLIVVRIGLELGCLMGDDGYSLCPATSFREGQLTAFLKVHHRIRIEVVDHPTVISVGKGEGATGMGVVVSPAFATYSACREVVHSFLHPLIAQVIVGAKGIDLVWCNLLEILDEFGHFVNAAP